jgi:hypothetical protein
VSSGTFGNHKLHNRLVLCSRKDWATCSNYYYCLLFTHTFLFALLNTPENPFASIYSESLIKTACQHLLLLVGFDTLIYQKYYDTPAILVCHQATGEEEEQEVQPHHSHLQGVEEGQEELLKLYLPQMQEHHSQLQGVEKNEPREKHTK